jgi:hypothetical protein
MNDLWEHHNHLDLALAAAPEAAEARDIIVNQMDHRRTSVLEIVNLLLQTRYIHSAPQILDLSV